MSRIEDTHIIESQRKQSTDQASNISEAIGAILNQAMHIHWGVDWDEDSQDFWRIEIDNQSFVENLAHKSKQVSAIGKLNSRSTAMLVALLKLGRRGTLSRIWTGVYFRPANLVAGVESKVFHKKMHDFTGDLTNVVARFYAEHHEEGLKEHHTEELFFNHAVAQGIILPEQNPRSIFLTWESVKDNLKQYCEWYRARCKVESQSMCVE